MPFSSNGLWWNESISPAMECHCCATVLQLTGSPKYCIIRSISVASGLSFRCEAVQYSPGRHRGHQVVWFWHQWSACGLHCQDTRCWMSALHGGQYPSAVLSRVNFHVASVHYPSSFVIAAGENWPSQFPERLRCSVGCVEFGDHPGEWSGNFNHIEQPLTLRCLGFLFRWKWLPESSLTPSGTASLISWRKWCKGLPRSCRTMTADSPASSETSQILGKWRRTLH